MELKTGFQTDHQGFSVNIHHMLQDVEVTNLWAVTEETIAGIQLQLQPATDDKRQDDCSGSTSAGRLDYCNSAAVMTYCSVSLCGTRRRSQVLVEMERTSLSKYAHKQEAQLSQTGRAMLRVTKHFAKPLKVILTGTIR